MPASIHSLLHLSYLPPGTRHHAGYVASCAEIYDGFFCFHCPLFRPPNRDVAALVTMSDGVLKPEKDFSKDADKLIPEAELLAKV